MKIKLTFSIEKTTYFFKRYYFWILGVILLILFCFNIFIYYQYVYLTTNTNVVPIDGRIVIDEEVIEKITKVIEEREDSLVRVKSKDYFNPFDD